MYKDVKKKLIALVLSICMVATVIEVVPIVRAAANLNSNGEYEITGQRSGSNTTQTFRVKVRNATFTYDGELHWPELDYVLDESGNEVSGVYIDEKQKQRDAGTYGCKLSATGYRFSEDESNQIPLIINPAKIKSLTVTYNSDETLKLKTNDGVKPTVTKVEASIGTTSQKTMELTADQYTVTSINTVGENLESILTVKNDKGNFAPDSQLTHAIKCDVAYDLEENHMYKVEFTDGGETDYTGNAVTPEIKIIKIEDPKVVHDVTSDFIVTYDGSTSRPQAAKTYEVRITPAGGDKSYSVVGGQYFTGTYKGFYTIRKKSSKQLHVYVDGPNSSRIDLMDSKNYLYLDYKDGAMVTPTNIKVQDDKGTVDCDISYENADKAGPAIMIVTPKSTTNYTGELRIEYFIRSELKIQSFEFDGYGAGVNKLVYSGSFPSLLNIQVTNQSDQLLEQGSNYDYEVYFDYYDTGANAWANADLTPATAATNANMKAAGKKKIIVKGRNGYYGSNIEQPFEIAKVDTENYGSRFSIEFTSPANYYNYDGTAKEPTFNLKYTVDGSSETVDPIYYTKEYSNNVNAGQATLKVTFKDNSNYSGTLTQTFQIKKLSLDDVVIVGAPFTYNRTPIEPELRIQNGTSGVDYAMVKGRDYILIDDEGTEITGDPATNAGTYTIKIKNNNTTNIDGTVVTRSYTINKANINDVTGFTLKGVNNGEIEWNGGTMEPELSGSLLVAGEDYTYAYTDNAIVTPFGNSGAAVVITATPSGNYTGEKKLYFKITPRSLRQSDIVTTGSSVTFNTSTKRFDITLDIEDEARGSYALSDGTEYDVSQVAYSVDGSIWVTQATTAITNLEKAGYYKVTITGKNDYKDSRTILLSCGINLAEGYSVHLDTRAQKYTYDGDPHTPAAIYVSVVDENNSVVPSDCYTISYARTDNVRNDPYATVGKIYVVATGNPEKGYYGKTVISEEEDAYYRILPAQWKSGTYEITVDTEGGITYDPERNTNDIPEVIVKYEIKRDIWKTLEKGVDYKLNWDDSNFDKNTLLTAGDKSVWVTGIGNYGDAGNYKRGTYTVAPVELHESMVKKVESSSYADGNPKFTLVYHDYTLEQTVNSSQIKDFTCVVSGSGLTYNPSSGKYETVYILTGKGNYTGQITVAIEVTKTNLSTADFADSAADALEGQFYVIWNEAELLIEDANLPQTSREQKRPENFTVMYKPIGGGTPFALEKGKDYLITGYGYNNAPGQNNGYNYVKIKGDGGYDGEKQINCLLYMDIDKAEFAEGSTITSGGAVDSTVFVEAYNNNNLDSLVKLLYDSGSGATEVDASHYDVTLVENSATGFGYKHLLIKGTKQDPYYFAGTKQIVIQTTGNLENATVLINNGKDVLFKGIPVTQPAISVKIGNKTLTKGTDFEIKEFTGNDTIGQATVTLIGLGDYRGTEITKEFNIVCSLSDVKIRVADEEDIMRDYSMGTQFSYAYTDGTADRPGVQPEVEVYLPNATGGMGAMLQLDTSYEVNYQNSDHAGVASIVITPIADQFLTGSRTISYTIRQTNIAPTTAGSISYSFNQRVTYTGNAITSSADGGLDLVIKDSNCNEQTLVEGRDYDVIYQANNRTDVTSESRVTINAKNGNYTGTYTFSFEIIPKSINAGDITVANSPIRMTYTGDKIVPIIKLKQTAGKQTDLIVDQDYEIYGYYDAGGHNQIGDAAHAPSQPGSYFVGIKGINNYNSTRLIPYEIVAKDIKDVEVTFVSTEHCVVDPRTNTPLCTYDATAHEPAVKVSFEGQELSTQDYIVTYTNNVNAGQATVTISANTSIERPKFSGSVDVNFDIKARSITEDLIDYQGITDGQEFPFDGNPVEPTVSITDKGLTGKPVLVFLQDYDITYEDDNDDFNEHKYAGEVTMKITGIGNYEGEKIFTFYIGEDISQAYALYNGSSSVSTLYNGLIQAPDPTKITVEKNGTSIEQGTYDIAYYKDTISKETKVGLDQFIDAGTYYITVVGVPSKGTYAKTPSQNCTYNITPKTIAGCTVSGYAGMYYYTGLPIQPVGITVTDTDLPQGNQASDGKRSVELVQNRDFTISYQNNNSAGKATIVATGIGNYTGTVYAYFTIENSTINNSGEGDSTSQGSISKDGMTTLTPDNIILTYDDSSNNFMRYTGAEVLPTVSFVGGYNRSDFEITGVNNVNPGKATLVIRGKGGNYSGAIYMYFNIKANLSTHGQMSAVPDQAYTGAILTPHVTVGVGNNVLTLNQDYQLTYSNNQNVGKATITAQGVGDYYYGSISTTFNISNGAGGMSVSGYASSYIYSGNAIEPDVTVTMNGVTLTKNRDYTVTYANNVNVGTATMTVRGIGSYSGTQTINYTIEAKNIENCVSNAIANVKYTGNTYTPVVALTDATTGKVLVQGSDYMITYSNNTNPGTASITITALSKNYVGTKVIPFKITSAAVTGLRTGTIKNNSIKLAWTSQSYADGYQICNAQNKVIATTANTSYTVKNLKSCTTYKYKVRSYVNNADGSMAYGDFSTAVSAKTLLNTPRLKAKSTKKGVVNLTWSKVSKATGYEIYYSTKRNGIYTKLKTVSSSSKRVYYDRGLATGEKYYYTIRAYRKVNGVKTYSNYNTIKAVTVK